MIKVTFCQMRCCSLTGGKSYGANSEACELRQAGVLHSFLSFPGEFLGTAFDLGLALLLPTLSYTLNMVVLNLRVATPLKGV